MLLRERENVRNSTDGFVGVVRVLSYSVMSREQFVYRTRLVGRRLRARPEANGHKENRVWGGHHGPFQNLQRWCKVRAGYTFLGCVVNTWLVHTAKWIRSCPFCIWEGKHPFTLLHCTSVWQTQVDTV